MSITYLTMNKKTEKFAFKRLKNNILKYYDLQG